MNGGKYMRRCGLPGLFNLYITRQPLKGDLTGIPIDNENALLVIRSLRALEYCVRSASSIEVRYCHCHCVVGSNVDRCYFGDIHTGRLEIICKQRSGGF